MMAVTLQGNSILASLFSHASANNCSTINLKDFKFAVEAYGSYQNFGTVALNLHNSRFDDAICKPSVSAVSAVHKMVGS